MFYIITIWIWVLKIRKLRFSQFCIFFLYCVCFAADLFTSVITLKFSFKSLSLYGCHITESNKWSRIKYLVRPQISVHGNFIFARSNDLIVPKKQPWNSTGNVLTLIKVGEYLQFNNCHIKASFLYKLDENWRIYSVEDIWRSFFTTIFAKSSIIDVRLNSKWASDKESKFTVNFKVTQISIKTFYCQKKRPH